MFNSTNRRKVILSTNIAESSITINEIYYVIDFCLVKELKYNVRTNHQSLDLNWASKASCNQRAGRAGRVGEGRVFRLVPRKFFENNQEDFSTPEILRVPLEKLILRVKVFNRGEPEEILGRALQPPNMKHIESAIINLQNMGALTLASENSKSGDLTELGIVYSEMPIDIKYSRLIMLGFAFDMLDPAIITACVLTHEKNIFKKHGRENYIGSYGLKNYFSDNSDSDMIKYYNAFKIWEDQFGNRLHNSQFSRKINFHTNRSEHQFCDEYRLDHRVLRDVLILSADIKNRLRKLQFMNEITPLKIDFKIYHNQLVFKLILGGAFYGNYAKCQFIDIEKLKKTKSCKLGYEAKRALTLKSIPMEIEENNLKSFIRTSIVQNIDEIKAEDSMNVRSKNTSINENDQFRIVRWGEDVIVEYDQNIFKESIKKMLTMGSLFRPRDTSFGLHMRDNYNHSRIIQLKRPDYLYELKLCDLFSVVQVDTEFNSINHVLINEDENIVRNLFVVYEDFNVKNGKYTAKHSTLMPPYPMLDLILMLIFTPKATFYPNEDNDRYGSFRLVGTEIEFRFNFHFASCDVVEINIIRRALNEIIKGKKLDASDLQDKKDNLKNLVLKLITKERILVISNDEWWRLFFDLYPHKKKEKENHLIGTKDLLKMFKGMEYMNTNKEMSNTNGNKINQASHNFRQKKKVENEKKSNDFLPPLELLDIKEDYRLFTEEGVTDLVKEAQQFNDMRNKIIEKIAENKKLVYQDKAELYCARCSSTLSSYICSWKSLEKVDDIDLYKINGWVSPFINVIKSDEVTQSMNNDELMRYIQDLFGNNIKIIQEFIACKSSNHLLGVKLDHEFYISGLTQLTITFPLNIKVPMTEDYFKNNFSLIESEEKKLLTLRLEKIKELECNLCLMKFNKTDDYLNHVDKDPHHKKRLAELLEENFTQNPQNILNYN